jgi:hypothetical protein
MKCMTLGQRMPWTLLYRSTLCNDVSLSLLLLLIVAAAAAAGVAAAAADGSRIIFRLSGTGSSGATIRLYIEQYTADQARLEDDAQQALAPIIKASVVPVHQQQRTTAHCVAMMSTLILHQQLIACLPAAVSCSRCTVRMHHCIAWWWPPAHCTLSTAKVQFALCKA